MNTDFEDYKEMMYDVRRTLGSEKERLKERVEQLDGFMRMAETTPIKTLWRPVATPAGMANKVITMQANGAAKRLAIS